MMRPRTRAQLDDAVVFIYELLDAHHDTIRLASQQPPNPMWQAHLEYLSALQRTGRELLARMTVAERDL
jgi:hypothetical protein